MNNYYLKEQIKNQHNNNLQNPQTMQNNQIVDNVIQKPKKNFSPKVGQEIYFRSKINIGKYLKKLAEK